MIWGLTISYKAIMNCGLSTTHPPCNNNKCFAFSNGRCNALTTTYFKGKCPFFKDIEEKKQEDIRCQARVQTWKDERKKRYG